MDCKIIAIGQKIPKWCQLGCEEYLKRLPRFMKCAVVEIPTALHRKGSSAVEQEGEKILQKINTQDVMIALDVKGTPLNTEQFALQLAAWQQEGNDLNFVIGGPEGLSSMCLKRANFRWSLSNLTFPHALVRILALEQIYRAATILAGHPYNK